MSAQTNAEPQSDGPETSHRITVAELRSFVERYELLDNGKTHITDLQKEVMAEAKGRGYDVKTLRKIIALRKKDAGQISEEEAVLELYRDALEM